MENIKKESLINLIKRLNQIDEAQQRLDMEYNEIIYELWYRIPTLRIEENMQPKVLKKEMKK